MILPFEIVQYFIRTYRLRLIEASRDLACPLTNMHINMQFDMIDRLLRNEFAKSLSSGISPTEAWGNYVEIKKSLDTLSYIFKISVLDWEKKKTNDIKATIQHEILGNAYTKEQIHSYIGIHGYLPIYISLWKKTIEHVERRMWCMTVNLIEYVP